MAADFIQRIKAATVAIASWNGMSERHPFSIIGSGFCIDPSGIVVTCRHVVDTFMERPTLEAIVTNRTGEIRPDGGEVLAPMGMREMCAVFYKMISKTKLAVLLATVTHVISKTDHHDLALLRVNPDSDFVGGFPTVEMAEPEEISEGDEIGTCGFPLGERLRDELGTVTSSFTKGIVSSILPGPGVPRGLLTGFQLDLGATGGNSGGPVFQWGSGRVFGALEGGVAHLTKAAAIHHVLDPETLDQLRRAKPGEMPVA